MDIPTYPQDHIPIKSILYYACSVDSLGARVMCAGAGWDVREGWWCYQQAPCLGKVTTGGQGSSQ